MEPGIAAALNNKLINSPRQLVNEYTFYLEGISEKITIRISLGPEGRFYFYQSHYIHTPSQIGAYMAGRTWAETEELALKQAISTLTSYYEMAVRDGHAPDDNWLVPAGGF
jgi:hypothetical protein